MKHSLDDFRLYDFGQARIRYDIDTEAIPDAEPDEDGEVPEKTTDERLETDYVHRTMFLWSAGARTWEEVRWVAFGTEQSRRSLVKRFGEETGMRIPLNSKRSEGGQGRSKENDGRPAEPWARAVIWEIWDKETKRVFWWSAGMPVTLDDEEDPLELKDFWPCPRPMLFNATTDAYIPRPDYMLAEDHYQKLDRLLTRINLLERAIAVRGVYDGKNEAIKKLLKEAAANELVPL